jgi:uncharacterized protein (TIGR02145 family)
MRTSAFIIFFCSVVLLNQAIAQNHAPEVTNVTFTQRADGSYLVDVYYDLYDQDGTPMTITMQVSADAGTTWDFSCAQISGDAGGGIQSGTNKHILWDFSAEHPQTFGDQFRIKIIADDGVQGGTVTDIDGNVYHTVTIGSQVWMVENLKVTHYRNGDVIQNVTDNTQWANLTTGAYCNYNNDSNNALTYGRLYNWYAVNDARKIAPAGWHVPTDAEWKQLEMYLGMSQSQADAAGWRGTDQGSQLKNSSGWYNNGNGINSSGFSALPGGYREYGGTFIYVGYYAVFWSSTESSSSSAWSRALYYDLSDVDRYYGDYKRYGFSVRCLRD